MTPTQTQRTSKHTNTSTYPFFFPFKPYRHPVINHSIYSSTLSLLCSAPQCSRLENRGPPNQISDTLFVDVQTWFSHRGSENRHAGRKSCTASGNQRPIVHCRLVVLQHTLCICIVCFLHNNPQYATVKFLYEMNCYSAWFGGTQLTVDRLNKLPGGRALPLRPRRNLGFCRKKKCNLGSSLFPPNTEMQSE